MAKSELAVLTSQCLSRRIPDKPTLEKEVAAWQAIETNITQRPTGNSQPKTPESSSRGLSPIRMTRATSSTALGAAQSRVDDDPKLPIRGSYSSSTHDSYFLQTTIGVRHNEITWRKIDVGAAGRLFRRGDFRRRRLGDGGAPNCPTQTGTGPGFIPVQTIKIFNDSLAQQIYAELEVGKPNPDLWIQDICNVPDAQKDKLYPYPTTLTNRFYINGLTGIPPGGASRSRFPSIRNWLQP